VIPQSPVTSVTKGNIELHIKEIWTVSKADSTLPFNVEGASRNEEEAIANELPIVGQDTRLNAR